ncbi:MAG: CHAT domain-containing tetratricopeptide repeat protein [Bacteroidota bacterium]|nr:CHAT domain-containing tetratricopeptide repeat protein [Bacteroidota bacterium]
MEKIIYSFFLQISILLSQSLFSQPSDSMVSNNNKIKEISEFYILSHESKFVFSDCLAYYDSCIAACKSSRELKLLVEAYINKANYYRFYQKNALAFQNLELASELMNIEATVELLNGLDYCYGAIYFMNGDLKLSSSYLDRIFNRLEKNSNAKPKAKYYQLKGNIFLQENISDSALSYYLKAYSLLRSEYPHENIYYPYYLSQIGQAYNKVLKINKSLSILDSAKRLMKRLNISNHTLEAGIENTIGNNFLLLGEFTKSRAYYFAANAHYSSMNRYDAVSFINFNIALTFHMENRYQEAIDYYNESLRSTKQIINIQKYKTIQGIASAYSALNDFDSAYYYHTKALAECKRIYGPQNINTMNRKSIIGSFYLDNNFTDSAYSYLSEAADFFDDHEIKSRQSFLTHLRLAELYRKNGDLPLALNTLGKSLKDFDDIESVFTKRNMYEFLYLQSRILYDSIFRIKNNESARKTINKAYKVLRACIHEYEKYLNRLDLEKNKLYFSSNNKKLYVLMLEILNRKRLIENNNSYLDSMLKYSERYKASVLLNQLTREKPLFVSDELLEIYREKQHTQNMIKILETELGNVTATGSMNKPGIMQLKALYERYDSLGNSLEHKNSRAKNPITSWPDKLDEKVKTLPNETLLIEYFFSDSILYIFQLSDKGIDLLRQKISKTDKERLVETLHSIKAFNPVKMQPNEIHDLKSNLHHLYKKLIQPTQHRSYSDLVIIADEILGLLPFEALIEKEPENSNRFNTTAFLLERNTISYAYSIHSFFAIGNMQYTVTYNPEVLCVSPFVFKKQKKGTDSAADFKELKFSEEEASQIGRYYNCKTIKPGVSDENIILKDLKNSDIIHFATHTIIDTNEIYGSRIILHPDETGDNKHSLNIAEIYNLDMKAELAFVNGCETGYGKYLNSGGYISIGRAFYTSGCPSVIMNIWKVDDRTSKNISADFYQLLSQGNNTAKALQLSKTNYIEQAYGYESHPHFWSSYLHFGQARKFVNNSNSTGIVTYILLSMLILSIIFVFRKRLKKWVN